MSGLHEDLPQDRFLPLPNDGADRRVGVEVEFAGLDVDQAARVIAARCGGRLEAQDARTILLQGSDLGDIRVELDIALKQQWAETLAAQVLGDLIPVEVITEPLAQTALPRVGALLQALVAEGALGTKARLAYGFGIHFNIELPSEDTAALVATARAFALCEDWLRAADPLDPARRVLPFVAPFPAPLRAALARARDWAPEDLARAMVAHAPSRNFGLDLLPALEHLCPDALSGIPEGHLKGGRPAFHYRLPEARLEWEDWSLAYEWNRWVVIETVAADAALLAALARDWMDHGAQASAQDWAARVEAQLVAAGVPARLGETPASAVGG